MRGKPTRHFKSKWDSAIAITIATSLCLASAWIVLGRSRPPAPTQSTDLQSTKLSQPDSARPVPAVKSQPSTDTPASPLVVAQPSGQTINSLARQDPPATPTRPTFVRQGVLRIGNPTDYPIRVALLAKKSGTEAATAKQPEYELPAHWDFAPQEGATKGLIVSLPDRTLKVKQGDVLVAFAQDGSRRYWGPYVMGETAVPVWNPKAAEWELILQP